MSRGGNHPGLQADLLCWVPRMRWCPSSEFPVESSSHNLPKLIAMVLRIDMCKAGCCCVHTLPSEVSDQQRGLQFTRGHALPCDVFRLLLREYTGMSNAATRRLCTLPNQPVTVQKRTGHLTSSKGFD